MTSWTLNRVQGDEAAGSCAVTKWDRALARFQTAQAAVHQATGGKADQERFDGLCDEATNALCALLALPAPDLRALAA